MQIYYAKIMQSDYAKFMQSQKNSKSEKNMKGRVTYPISSWVLWRVPRSAADVVHVRSLREWKCPVNGFR